jgi:hypothetical protein
LACTASLAVALLSRLVRRTWPALLTTLPTARACTTSVSCTPALPLASTRPAALWALSISTSL